MAQISNARTGELLRALFIILARYPEGLKARDALAELAQSVTLTEYEQGSYESGRRFEKIVRFATVDTVRAGWMIKDGGVWLITDEGKKALTTYPEPLEFHRAAARLYRSWRKSRKKAPSAVGSGIVADGGEAATDAVEDESDKDVAVSYEEAREQAQATISDYLHGMDPYDFQKLVADLLQGMGYHVAWIAPPGKDGGVDVIAYTDPLGTQGPRIKVQVKQQQSGVSLPGLKSFIANIGQHDSGIFVCTGGFTRDAQEFARSQESKRIMLIDLDKLVDLWVQFMPKLHDKAWQRLPLTPLYFLTPQE